MLAGCGRPPSRVETGVIATKCLQWGNMGEPQDIDPHTVSGVPEQHIIDSLFEGLVMSDARDLHPVPGVAEPKMGRLWRRPDLHVSFAPEGPLVQWSAGHRAGLCPFFQEDAGARPGLGIRLHALMWPKTPRITTRVKSPISPRLGSSCGRGAPFASSSIPRPPISGLAEPLLVVFPSPFRPSKNTVRQTNAAIPGPNPAISSATAPSTSSNGKSTPCSWCAKVPLTGMRARSN